MKKLLFICLFGYVSLGLMANTGGVAPTDPSAPMQSEVAPPAQPQPAPATTTEPMAPPAQPQPQPTQQPTPIEPALAQPAGATTTVAQPTQPAGPTGARGAANVSFVQPAKTQPTFQAKKYIYTVLGGLGIYGVTFGEGMVKIAPSFQFNAYMHVLTFDIINTYVGVASDLDIAFSTNNESISNNGLHGISAGVGLGLLHEFPQGFGIYEEFLLYYGYHSKFPESVFSGDYGSPYTDQATVHAMELGVSSGVQYRLDDGIMFRVGLALRTPLAGRASFSDMSSSNQIGLSWIDIGGKVMVGYSW